MIWIWPKMTPQSRINLSEVCHIYEMWHILKLNLSYVLWKHMARLSPMDNSNIRRNKIRARYILFCKRYDVAMSKGTFGFSLLELSYFMSVENNHLGCSLAKDEQLHGKRHPFILRSRKRIELISCLLKWSRSWFQNDHDRQNDNSRTVRYICLCEYQLGKDVTFLSIPQRDGGVSGVRYKFYLNIIMPRKSYIHISQLHDS